MIYCFFFLGQLYAMQHGMEIDKSSKEARAFLMALMDYLEKVLSIFTLKVSENSS